MTERRAFPDGTIGAFELIVRYREDQTQESGVLLDTDLEIWTADQVDVSVSLTSLIAASRAATAQLEAIYREKTGKDPADIRSHATLDEEVRYGRS